MICSNRERGRDACTPWLSHLGQRPPAGSNSAGVFGSGRPKLSRPSRTIGAAPVSRVPIFRCRPIAVGIAEHRPRRASPARGDTLAEGCCVAVTRKGAGGGSYFAFASCCRSSMPSSRISVATCCIVTLAPLDVRHLSASSMADDRKRDGPGREHCIRGSAAAGLTGGAYRSASRKTPRRTPAHPAAGSPRPNGVAAAPGARRFPP